MSDDIAIKVGADISALTTALDSAARSVGDFADRLAGEFDRASAAAGKLGQGADKTGTAIGQSAAGAVRSAQQSAEKIAQIQKRTADQSIAGDEQLNRDRLAMGQETALEFANAERELADRKYDADLKALQDEESRGRLSHALYLAQKEALDQSYANKVLQIREQAEARQRQMDRETVGEALKNLDLQLKDGKDAIEQEYREHRIGADEKAAAERKLTADILGEEIQRLTDARGGYAEGTNAYRQYTNQILALQRRLSAQLKAINDQQLDQERQKWQQFSTGIASSVGSALKGMIFQHQSWKQAVGTIIEGVADQFIQMGERMLADWITRSILQETISDTTSISAAETQIQANAATAASGAYSSAAAIPYVGWMIAPGVAMEAMATVESFSGMLPFEVGAWELPHDMPGMLHKGEMIVPENFASGLRSNGGLSGAGGDLHVTNHYAPTIHSREPRSIQEMLRREQGSFVSEIGRLVRNGALSTQSIMPTRTR